MTDYYNDPIVIFDDFFDALHLLKPSEFMVFMVLRKLSHDRTTQETSIHVISTISGLSAPTVRKNIKSLKEKGCIESRQVYDEREKQYYTYYRVFPDPKRWKIFSQNEAQ